MSWKDLFRKPDETAAAEVESPGSPVPARVEDRVTPAPELPPGLGEWWWLVTHHGHDAFYLRTLMPGDLAPGRLPALRHVRLLERGEGLPAEVRCGTCGEIPRSEDLDPIERATGQRGFLAGYRTGRAKWPKPTKAETCWMCSGQAPVAADARLRGTAVRVCAGCEKHLNRRT